MWCKAAPWLRNAVCGTDDRFGSGPRASHRSAAANGTNQASGTVQALARMCSLVAGPGIPSSASRARAVIVSLSSWDGTTPGSAEPAVESMRP